RTTYARCCRRPRTEERHEVGARGHGAPAVAGGRLARYVATRRPGRRRCEPYDAGRGPRLSGGAGRGGVGRHPGTAPRGGVSTSVRPRFHVLLLPAGGSVRGHEPPLRRARDPAPPGPEGHALVPAGSAGRS